MSDSQFQDITKSFLKGSSFEKEMIAKNQQIRILQEEIGGLAETNNEMKREMKRLVRQVEKREETVKEVTRNELKLSKKIIECEDGKEKLKKDFESSEKKYNQLLESIMTEKTQQLEISQHLEENIAGYEKSIRNLEQSLQKSQQTVSILSREVEQQEKKITELAEENQKLSIQSKEMNQINEQLKKQLTEQQQSTNAMKNNLHNQIKDLEMLLVQNLTENDTSIQSSSTLEIEKLQAKLTNYEEEKRQLLDKINVQIKMIVEKDEKLDDLSKLYDQALDQQTKNNINVNDLNKKIAEMMTENCALNLEMENLNKEKAMLNDKITKLQIENVFLAKDFLDVKTELETLKKDTRGLQQELFKAETEKENLLQQLSRLKEEIQNQRVAMKLHEEEYKKKPFVDKEERQEQYTFQQLEKITRCYVVQILQKIQTFYNQEKEQKQIIKDQLNRVNNMVHKILSKYWESSMSGEDNKMWENHAGNKKYIENKPSAKKYQPKQKK